MADVDLQRRAQPGTGNPPAIQYPTSDELDVANGWRRDSGPAADDPQDSSILPWATQIVEELPF